MQKIFIMLFAVFLLTAPAFATPQLPNANNFFREIDSGLVEQFDSAAIGSVLSGLLWVIFRIGYAIAIFVLMYIAIQMIIAPPRKKADVKAAFAPYLIGLLLLVAGVPIAALIIKMFIETF